MVTKLVLALMRLTSIGCCEGYLKFEGYEVKCEVGIQNRHQKRDRFLGAYSLLLLFGDTLKRTFNAFALSGRDCSNTWDPGCRYACPGLGVPLGL